MDKIYKIYELVRDVQVDQYFEGKYSPDRWEKRSDAIVLKEVEIWASIEDDYGMLPNRFLTEAAAEKYVGYGQIILGVYE